MIEENNIHEQLKQYSLFLTEYATCLLASGVHTTRVIRNTCRVASAFHVRVEMTILHKTVNITLTTLDGLHVYNKVSTIHPRAISFRLNTDLSALSWQAYDEHLSLPEVQERYNAILSKPRMNEWVVLALVGIANAAFCGLFQGDLWACTMVAVATWLGYLVKILMGRKHRNVYGIWFTCALLSSIIASFCGYFHLGSTPDTAIAASVLYLVPGVPLINSVIDTVEGHVLAGFARLIDALLLIGCMAIGLLCTMLLTGGIAW